ncbi:MAG TPA: alpha/beta hydrolase [Verrucomicrobiae bacterium]|nr:alpha/beta hydrolase [Verrucomicrobiae bacterium]
MNPQTETLTLDDGAITHVDFWGERGPTLLCVHGMTSSRKSWELLGLHLADRYRVVAYDQRGHGDSAGVAGPMTLARAQRDLENVAAYLDETPFALLGHSWGGAVVLLAGRSLSVEKVVAIDPMLHQAENRWYAEFLGDLAAIFAVSGQARADKVREEYAQSSQRDGERKVHAVATMDAGVIERLRDENAPADWDLRETVSAYPRPLLVAVAGSAESIIDPADLALLQARGGENVRVVVFDGQDHSLHRTDFEHFTTVLDEFLEAG